jgi:hypothetical protein
MESESVEMPCKAAGEMEVATDWVRGDAGYPVKQVRGRLGRGEGVVRGWVWDMGVGWML